MEAETDSSTVPFRQIIRSCEVESWDDGGREGKRDLPLEDGRRCRLGWAVSDS